MFSICSELADHVKTLLEGAASGANVAACAIFIR
jgi:hypothetical protein